MGLSLPQAVSELKKMFPDILDINDPAAIRQNGLYLYFDGSAPVSATKDRAHFIVLLAGNSFSTKELMNEGSPVCERLSVLRKTLFEYVAVNGNDLAFKGIKAAMFEGSTLYVYAISIGFDIVV